MSLAWISVAALVLAITLSCTTTINVGVLSLALALIVAFGVLDAIADMGRGIGSDLRVIGFDDVHDAGLNRPSLSSVAVPARETGRRAAHLALERAAGSSGPTVREEFPTKLEPRETCGCPRPQLLDSPAAVRGSC